MGQLGYTLLVNLLQCVVSWGSDNNPWLFFLNLVVVLFFVFLIRTKLYLFQLFCTPFGWYTLGDLFSLVLLLCGMMNVCSTTLQIYKDWFFTSNELYSAKRYFNRFLLNSLFLGIFWIQWNLATRSLLDVLQTSKVMQFVK